MRGVVILSAVLIVCLSRFASAACNTNSECLTAAAPYCFNQTCLGCLVNAHCRASEYCNNAGMCAARPSCGQCNHTNALVCSASKCVQCAANSDCASGVCDTVVKVCRPPTSCAANATLCAGTDRPVCSSQGACVECLSDSDCSAAFPTCTAAGVCTAKVLQPLFLCSQNSTTANKRTLYTAFKATQNNVNVVYPVGSRNALYVVGKETVLLNSEEDFQLVNTTRLYFYPQSLEQIDIDIGAQVTWYLDGVLSTITLDETSDCPTNVSFLVGVSDLTFVTENSQNVTDTIATALEIDSSRVYLQTNVLKRSTQQSGTMEVTVANGADIVLAVLSDPTTFNDALTNIGLAVSGVQGVTLSGESIPTPDGTSSPLAGPTAPGAAPVDSPTAPTSGPATPSTNVVPITPVVVFSPATDNNPSDVVATPGTLDSGIIVAIVVVCVVVAAAVIVIAVVVSRNKKKKSGGGSGSSRMERGSATEMKETTSASALVTTTNPAKKADSESSDEDEESGEDVDSSDEDEESGEESGSEVSGSGSNEGSSAEGSGSNEGSASGSEASS